MATVRQYVTQIRAAQDGVAGRLGSSVNDKRLRIVLTMAAIPAGVVMKLLVDKGLITNAELTTTFNDAVADAWPEEPDPTG
jgi:hypothetical protein